MQQWQCLCKYRPLIHFVVLIPHWKYDKGVSKYYPPVLLMRRKIDSTRSKWQYVYLYENYFKAAEKINMMKYVIHHINGNKTKKSECNE